MTYDGPRRWTCPNGARLGLIHLTNTGNTTGPHPQGSVPRSRNGWTLTVKAPSGVITGWHHLPGLDSADPARRAAAAAQLTAALDATSAVPDGEPQALAA